VRGAVPRARDERTDGTLLHCSRRVDAQGGYEALGDAVQTIENGEFATAHVIRPIEPLVPIVDVRAPAGPLGTATMLHGTAGVLDEPVEPSRKIYSKPKKVS
jgi:hypothetical protein